MKKVILLLVDSLMPDTLESCIRQKTVPALQFLQDRGRYWRECATVFPTMTASVDSSLVTGVYPDVHRVPGLIWFDPQEQQIVDYLNGWRCVWKLGLARCARNVLYDLNEKHLSKRVTTLFEELAARGKTSASLNTIIHRGTRRHPVRLPWLVQLATRFRLQGDVSGPEVLTLGEMVKMPVEPHIPRRAKRLKNHYGINDTFAVHAAKALIESRQQPDFMLVYLPDNDHQVHRQNPEHAETALIRVDRRIQQMLGAFGSWETAIERCVWIVTGDHGQTRIGPQKAEFNIDLDKLLQPFRVLQLGEKLRDHDLVVCNNERMVYLYPQKPDLLQPILQRLGAESRIDLIAWKQDGGVMVREAGSGRQLFFARGGPHVDIYGSAWTITGDWRVLDLTEAQGRIGYGDYPDALNRLYGALHSQDVPLIVITARPRYEFICRYYPRHLNGGCHGSLHKQDSLVPLIVTGTDHPLRHPPRLVDLKPFILEVVDAQPAL